MSASQPKQVSAQRFLWHSGVVVCLCFLSWVAASNEYRTAGGANAEIFSVDSIGSVGIINRFDLSGREYEYIRFQAEVTAKDLPDAQGTGTGRYSVLVYVRLMEESENIYYGSTLRLNAGSHDVVIDDLIAVPPSAESMELGVVDKVSGVWEIQSLSLSATELSNSYLLTRAMLALLWAMLAVYFLHTATKAFHFTYVVFVSLTIAIAISATLASQALIQSIVNPPLLWVAQKVSAFEIIDANRLLDFGHVFMFMLITSSLLGLGGKRGLSSLIVLGYCILLAVSTEVLQKHSFTRSPQLSDLILDFIGVAVGYCLYRLVKGVSLRMSHF